MKLSFAHAEGRNYRQLPDRARLREEPTPADIIYSKRYSLSELDVSGSMSFLAQEYKAEGYFGFVMRVDSGMKWVAGVDAAQASLHQPSVVSQPHDASICFGGTSVRSPYPS